MLEMWVVYANPKDYPDKFVVRLWKLAEPTPTVYIADTLDEVRKHIPPGLYRNERHPNDDKAILEVWF